MAENEHLAASDVYGMARQLNKLFISSPRTALERSLLHDVLPPMAALVNQTLTTLKGRPRDAVRTAIALGELPSCPPGAVVEVSEAVRGQLGLVPGPDLAQLAVVLAQLSVRPGNAFLGAFMPAAEARLGELTGPQLASLLWALVRMGVAPTTAWVRAYEDATRAKLQELSCEHLSRLAWACGQIGLQPGAAWMSGLLMASQLSLRRFAVHELCDMLWGLGRMRPAGVGGEWQAELLAVSQGIMGKLQPGELVALLVAVSAVGCAPSTTWVSAALQHSHKLLPACSPRELSELLPALLQLTRCAVPAVEPAGITAAAAAAVPVARPFAAAMAGASTAAATPASTSAGSVSGRSTRAPAPATVRIPKAWLQAYMGAAQQLLPRFTAQALAHTLISLVAAGARPSIVWMRAYSDVLRERLGVLGGAELAGVVQAMGALRYKPPRSLLQPLLAGGATKMSLVSDGELVGIATALADMAIQPDAEWGKVFLSETQHRAARLGGDSLASIAKSAVRLRLQPSEAWWAHIMGSMRPHIGGMSPAGLGDLLWAVGTAGYDPGSDFMQQAVQAVEGHISGEELPRAVSRGNSASRRVAKAGQRGAAARAATGNLSAIAGAPFTLVV